MFNLFKQFITREDVDHALRCGSSPVDNQVMPGREDEDGKGWQRVENELPEIGDKVKVEFCHDIVYIGDGCFELNDRTVFDCDDIWKWKKERRQS